MKNKETENSKGRINKKTWCGGISVINDNKEASALVPICVLKITPLFVKEVIGQILFFANV